MKKAWVLSYLLSTQRRLWSDWVDAQADLSLLLGPHSFCWFCHVVAQIQIRSSSTKSQQYVWISIFHKYHKTPKNSEPEKFAVVTLKLNKEALPWSNVSKRCRGNCKQCRPWSHCSSRSSLIWVCTVCPDLSVRKLRIILVKRRSVFSSGIHNS